MKSFKILLYPGTTSKSKKLKERTAIQNHYKWKTNDIFSSDKIWEDNFSYLQNMLGELEPFRGRLQESADCMLDCLIIRDNINILLGKLSLYANLKSDEDSRVSIYQAYRERISGLAVRIAQVESFIEPELLAVPEDVIRTFIKRNKKLARYGHYFDDLLRSKKHVLNQEGEHLLALTGDMSQTPYQIFSMFNNADIKFPVITDESGTEIELTKGNFIVFMKSADRKVRENAFRTMYHTYNQWINTLSASLSSAIKRDIFYARARRYSSAIEASLDVHNIAPTVYDNVITAINQNLDPLHHYISLRKRIMDLQKVMPWDLYVPLLKDFRWEVSYEDAIEIVEKALEPLGPDYKRIMKTAFTGGWFDVFENTGKRSGAYSSATYGIAHPFMLLNYQGMLDDVFTIAHEMGHSMHSYFTLQHQPYIYSDYTIFVAEVASTLNEALLMDYLLRSSSDRDKKLYLLNQYIDQLRGTLYVQSIFAEFEKIIHEKAESGEALTAELLNRITGELYSRYYGPDFAVDSLYEINWCRIPHFYYNFYVYQYVTGISAATTLAARIIEGDRNTRDAYLHFLKEGSSDYSINLLNNAGVDMTTPEPIESTARLMGNLLEQMEELLE
jgi:oligoendopeptidase F